VKILVTGSNGMIGKHLCAALKEHEITELDIGGYHKPRPREFDGIIHLAAVSRVSAAEKDPVQAMATNVLGTCEMLNIPHGWFIFASTTEKPTNVYGLSKRTAEEYIRLRSQRYIILRLANVYGPGMAEDKLLPKIRNGASFKEDVLPFEHIHVDDVCAQIKTAMAQFERPGFKSYTMKLATGVAKTPKELLDVAASY
jgi:nucleoside-diphosphate-sugar epimerase